MNEKKTLTQIGSLRGKKIIIRAGLNVPLDNNGVILDDYRIIKFLPTLNYLVEQEAKIIIIAHIGRNPTDTLQPVAEYIAKHIPIAFKDNFFADNGAIADNCTQLQNQLDACEDGSVFMLDNIRQTNLEKENSPVLAQQLADLAEIYVNEAFSVSHRSHMSLQALPQSVQTSVTGMLCHEEIEQLSLALQPGKNSVAVIGGNKFATKLPLISQFLDSYSQVVVSGALANTLYSLSGYEIGTSVYESDLDADIQLSLRDVSNHPHLYLPAIVVTVNQSNQQQVKHISEVSKTDSIVDIAPEGLVELESSLAEAQFIVWNGPLGFYEGGYTAGTNRMLELVALNTFATSLVGGGNTVDAVRDAGREQDMTFLSTGGGAMIEFLTHGTLPALDALD